MSRARSCVCSEARQRPEIRRNVAQHMIAVTCNACMRFISQRCRVCLRSYKDLALHLAKSECGPFDKAGMWWTADRPPWAGKPEQAPGIQLQLGGLRD